MSTRWRDRHGDEPFVSRVPLVIEQEGEAQLLGHARAPIPLARKAASDDRDLQGSDAYISPFQSEPRVDRT
jgi:predicted FMN-binding regulatory protein PaiB